MSLTHSGCSSQEESELEAEQEELLSESSALLTLSPQAQKMIGVKVAPIEKKLLPSAIRSNGWVLTKPGKEAVIKAPSAGYFIPLDEEAALEIGTQIASEQPLGKLKVFLSPQEEAQMVLAKEEADILINQSRVTLRLAEQQLERLKKTPEGTVAGTRLMELEETVERAKVAYRESQDKLPYLPKEPYGANLELKEVVIESPQTGRIISQEAVLGQFVTQGDPLWTVVDWSTMWVKIPLFVDDVFKILPEEEIEVTLPGLPTTFAARPVNVTQSTEPGRRTIDLLYEIDNTSGLLRAGQPVEVRLPTQQATEQLTVPRSAIVWDGFGNAWVYVRVNEKSFRRQQVELGDLTDESVVVTRGLKEEQQIVTVGAEALYGEEFKGQISLEDDD
ncbi:MAG: efflux RND transporter periplasmic adaptor subunit [Planctomycetaceae bacterium]|nr:efflux RND transporter periplasmic adaptor subunit [Planctomycetaceae bacterium]